MHFFGNNDATTLKSVVETLRRAAKGYRRYPVSKRKIDLARCEAAADALEHEASYIEEAIKNGPMPDLSKLRITIPEESRRRLLEDAAASDTNERSE